ncbi:hypothetical protein TNCV_1527581 [Trichonephila clavipes]|nr:hypothetical protein TNCV_1527581 [Trichonephila clavipes]
MGVLKIAIEPQSSSEVVGKRRELWLTTGVTQPFAMMNFVGLDMAFADQVTLVTTTLFNYNTLRLLDGAVGLLRAFVTKVEVSTSAQVGGFS